VEKRRPEEIEAAPLSRYIEALVQVKAQDVEAAPQGGVRLRQGVAEDRRISIEDAGCVTVARARASDSMGTSST
jgi:hypothetical protein